MGKIFFLCRKVGSREGRLPQGVTALVACGAQVRLRSPSILGLPVTRRFDHVQLSSSAHSYTLFLWVFVSHKGCCPCNFRLRSGEVVLGIPCVEGVWRGLDTSDVMYVSEFIPTHMVELIYIHAVEFAYREVRKS